MGDDPSKRITVTLPSGQIASAIVNLAVRKKPIGWSHHSFSTYYKEPYARWIQKEIDDMIATRQSKVFPYANFKNTSPNSLYLRINQAMRYLVECLDPTGVYRKFRDEIRIKRVRGCGVVLEFDEVLEGDHKGQSYVKPSDSPKWKQKIDDYLEKENPNGQPLHISNLLLSDLEVEQLKLELDGLDNILFTVTNREVKIIKGV